MSSLEESGIGVDVKKNGLAESELDGRKTEESVSSHDNQFADSSKISVSHITISKLGADETSISQGHLGFIKPATNNTKINGTKPPSYMFLAIFVGIVMPVFGIPAILIALMSKRLAAEGKLPEAKRYSNYSLLLSVTGLQLVIAAVVIANSLVFSRYNSDITTTSPQDSDSPEKVAWLASYGYKLPYRRNRGSIYDINYDTFNRYL